MRTTSSPILRIALTAVLALAALMPSARPATAADPLILRVGTIQDVDALNPFNTALSSGYEAFTLNYDLLVGFGPNLEPAPGYAVTWARKDNGDGTYTWTFGIRPGMLWSDGQPATSEDARWTLQLVLDAINAGTSVGLGYIDPDLSAAGVTKVEAPDPTTLVLTNTDPSERILQMYIPILPKHIWKGQTLDTIGNFPNDPPVVGTGPYQAVEWKTGQYVRFARNPHYWGTQGAADQVVINIYRTDDAMTLALKAGELDYASGLNANQFAELKTMPDIATAAGALNGWTMLDLNCYSKDIPGGGASTKALRDPAFRDALGYAIDKNALVERVLSGWGTPGTTQVPPFQAKWHVEPDKPRTFDIEVARQKLADAGYPLDSSGNRLDKEGKPISLRLYLPSDSPDYPRSAAFIQKWFGQLGIKVPLSTYDGAALYDLELPPEAGDGYTADWDMIIWGWTGYADPNPLLRVFTTGAIGSTSDSLWSNPTYDTLFDQQNMAANDEERHALMAQMQNLFYDQAPYHMLYYNDTLVAYRTDRFAGWQNQPANGVPLFEYGALDYTLLTVAGAASPSPVPTESSPAGSATPGASSGPTTAPTPAASTPAEPVTPADGGSSGGPVLLLVLGVVVLAVVATVALRRGQGSKGGAEDE